MSEKNKKIQDLRGQLTSADTKMVLQGLDQIKENGEAELIPDMLQVMESTEVREIHVKVLEILNNLNSQAAASEVIRQLEHIEDQDVKAQILASCWKNGLDYSPHVDRLVDIFIHADLMNAIEAFTIIENSTQNLSNNYLDQARDEIKDNLNQIQKEKKPLMMELIHLLDSKKTE